MSRTVAVLALVLAACGDSSTAPSPDASDAPDAPHGPITAPPNTWTWIEIAGTTCANGTPAGFGINVPATPSTELFVYFQGGGACWDASTCFTLKSAVNIETTYDAARFAADLGGAQADRSAGNVFGRATLVWVPYCTGDLHAGIEIRDYVVAGATRTVHHTGGTNTQRFVDALQATVPDASKIWLSGSSAGGYGATFNQHRFAAAWPGVDVHVLQDGSPFVPVLTAYETWQAAWSLQFPPGCAGCATSLPSVIDAVTAAHPRARIGLLTYDDDAVIKQYFGYAPTAGSLVPATTMLLANQYDLPTTRAFVLAGSSHTMFAQIGTLVGPGNVRLSDWIAQWATGDAAWTTVR
ncbi:MAG: hypothetical protein JNL83_22985 [Myxococcales bacterium]|nr:hypothetical protein [Myxococcales bacterium]